MGRNNSRFRRAERRDDAEARQQLSDKLTHSQRLEALDKRLGPGVGAARERQRLTLIQNDDSHEPIKKRQSKKRRNRRNNSKR